MGQGFPVLTKRLFTPPPRMKDGADVDPRLDRAGAQVPRKGAVQGCRLLQPPLAVQPEGSFKILLRW